MSTSPCPACAAKDAEIVRAYGRGYSVAYRNSVSRKTADALRKEITRLRAENARLTAPPSDAPSPEEVERSEAKGAE